MRFRGVIPKINAVYPMYPLYFQVYSKYIIYIYLFLK